MKLLVEGSGNRRKNEAARPQTLRMTQSDVPLLRVFSPVPSPSSSSPGPGSVPQQLVFIWPPPGCSRFLPRYLNSVPFSAFLLQLSRSYFGPPPHPAVTSNHSGLPGLPANPFKIDAPLCSRAVCLKSDPSHALPCFEPCKASLFLLAVTMSDNPNRDTYLPINLFLTDNLHMAQCRLQVANETSFDRCVYLCNSYSIKDSHCFSPESSLVLIPGYSPRPLPLPHRPRPPPCCVRAQ